VLILVQGRTYPRPPSRIPQSRSKHKARRRAQCGGDKAVGCAGCAARGEESQGEQVVSAQGDQLAEDVYIVVQGRRGEVNGMSIEHRQFRVLRKCVMGL
jgi:hypothetical protein